MARASSAEAAFGSTVTFPGGAVVPDWSAVTTPSARAALTALFAAFIGSLLAGAAIVLGVHFGVGQYLHDRVTFITDWVGLSDAAIVIPVIIIIGLVLAALSAGFAIRRWLRA